MSKRKREYIRRLTHEDRVRCEIVIEKGRVSKFLIQYESFVWSEWRAIARYDTAHDHVHLDIVLPNGSVKKKWFYRLDFDEGLNFAYEDIETNWERYKQWYL